MGISKVVDSAILIAIATFLWYRKGRLWNFYDSLLAECTKQIKKHSLDRKAWEQIALEQCEVISREIFNSLFRFESEYLRQKVLDNRYRFWIPDSEADTEKLIIYKDKEQYCKHEIKKLFYSDFRFCGLPLFFKALWWKITRKDSEMTSKEEHYLKSNKK